MTSSLRRGRTAYSRSNKQGRLVCVSAARLQRHATRWLPRCTRRPRSSSTSGCARSPSARARSRRNVRRLPSESNRVYRPGCQLGSDAVALCCSHPNRAEGPGWCRSSPMARVEWAVFCERVALDARGQPVIVAPMRRLNVDAVPVPLESSSILVAVAATPGDLVLAAEVCTQTTQRAGRDHCADSILDRILGRPGRDSDPSIHLRAVRSARTRSPCGRIDRVAPARDRVATSSLEIVEWSVWLRGSIAARLEAVSRRWDHRDHHGSPSWLVRRRHPSDGRRQALHDARDLESAKATVALLQSEMFHRCSPNCGRWHRLSPRLGDVM